MSETAEIVYDACKKRGHGHPGMPWPMPISILSRAGDVCFPGTLWVFAKDCGKVVRNQLVLLDML